MRAAVLKGGTISIETLPDPTPLTGQILIKPFQTGICGSDLSLHKQMAELEESLPEGERAAATPAIVPGHEFCGEVVDIPSGTETDLKVGDLITALPFTEHENEPHCIGLSPIFSGGIATLTCVDAVRSFKLPDGVPSELGALTEPFSVGLHAANLANRSAAPNIVIGCGPVGLAVIMALRLAGRGPIIAADFSPERAAIAEALGADHIVNPAATSPYTAWQDFDFTPAPMSPLLPRDGNGRPGGLNIFECTGVQGVLGDIIQNAPAHSHVIIVGVCPHEETFTPVEGITRELSLDFSFAYRPDEFGAALDLIARHPEDMARFITSRRPLAETAAAFDTLATGKSEIKILIEPNA